jgi:hydroxylaminobenzene mutase
MGRVTENLASVRHPLDPDPVRSSKAIAVLALGITAALTGFLVGGRVPATLALLMARQVRAELSASGGYLTGWRHLSAGVALAWVGIVLAATAVVIATIVGLLHLAQTPGGRNFAPNVN